MQFSSGTKADYTQQELNEIYAYRYGVFVDRLGWELPGSGTGLDIDQFDRPDTIHVCARNDQGEMCGYARLLPTKRPYLLEEVFPELMNGVPPPKSEQVWEISRFSSMDLRSNPTESAQIDLWVGREVLAECVRCAINNDIKRFITVSPLGIEKLLRKVGVTNRRAGPPMRSAGYALFACWIENDEKTLEALDCNFLSVA